MKSQMQAFSILCLMILGGAVSAQTNILNAKMPGEMFEKTESQIQLDNDKPLPYGYVDSRDVLWGKNTWEIVDLDERVNFPLYYPVDTNNIGSDRRSLYDVLVKNVKEGKLDIYADSYFNQKIELNDIAAAMSRVDTTDLGIEQINAGYEVDEQYIDRRDISAADIEQYWIRGYWYFDKRQGELKYRLIGLAPVAPDVNFIDDEDPVMVPLFWVWYPTAREVLHEAKVFNPQNSAQPISFDHILNSRRFNGVIYQVDNIQGDRQVKEYIADNAMMQLLESQRIKEQIRNFEIDMWNY
ncbi:MAG TPA: gliding motility protein GldN [Leeuwenhoekiella sp.]|uniref:type IX secretion system ring protein PorN/GldN n=1 Tax=Leeuwenhoekiella palythoae TaxID=573501 RepID=UPI000C6B34AB|nr:gliding motility protein GldN [Leeuwenhoekiella palythoae]MAS19618.1 gliding motility protein GldN [Leeuwenhoekiella sp.]UBZ09300.1 gliding motility protein GldN [Leeuwenhoekiella palythoae]HAX13986.1 gliding motility protein GldN [Leeuwenhoekiella sp.]HCQ75839.1 gliding motility protein GldN [Leeuwenhoekiella sp.]|tara:strand:- start:3118 stop:4008 length:891 start_codon:yes stop_codon:yes gene_type:complete